MSLPLRVAANAPPEWRHAPAPPLDLVVRAARALRAASGLQLFNFDVIVSASDAQAYVVDMNHFPSFTGWLGWERHLALLLLEVMRGAQSDS